MSCRLEPRRTLHVRYFTAYLRMPSTCGRSSLFSSLYSVKGFSKHVFTRNQPDILGELGPQLSPNAAIVLPNNTQFANLTERWAVYAPPTFQAVVEVAIDQDVQKTVEN